MGVPRLSKINAIVCVSKINVPRTRLRRALFVLVGLGKINQASSIPSYNYCSNDPTFALGAEMREAIQHALQVNREGNCQWPRARVIPVRDVYPSPSTTYVPHCAILHRCSDDTGCCRSEALTCVPKHSHRVELFFYVSPAYIFFSFITYHSSSFSISAIFVHIQIQ